MIDGEDQKILFFPLNNALPHSETCEEDQVNPSLQEKSLVNASPALTPEGLIDLQTLHDDANQPGGLDLELGAKLEMAKKKGKFLEALSLSATKVTDGQLEEVLNACLNLKILKLMRCSEITKAIKDLPQNLELLNLFNCKTITDAAIKDLLLT